MVPSNSDSPTEDEKEQLKKIKLNLASNEKFKETWRKLYAENPELMSGIPMDMRYDPRKVERERVNRKKSNWEEMSNWNKPYTKPYVKPPEKPERGWGISIIIILICAGVIYALIKYGL